MEFSVPYFHTATILKWQKLLASEENKLVIIQSLKYLIDRSKIRLYGYVIMPNHIHLIWELLEPNGREFPSASFKKFTAHAFLKSLKHQPEKVKKFYVDTDKRTYQFWQAKSKSLELYSRYMVEQKLDYIHANPVQPHWKLVSDPRDYRFSSMRFYEQDVDEFCILTHYRDRL